MNLTRKDDLENAIQDIENTDIVWQYGTRQFYVRTYVNGFMTPFWDCAEYSIRWNLIGTSQACLFDRFKNLRGRIYYD